MKPNSSPEYFSEEDCISRGDFLELNDLAIPGSHSSSSQNSSCPSNISEVSFGSSAFLRDIEEVANTLKQEEEQQQLPSSGYRFTASVMPNDVVLQPVLSGMQRTELTLAPVKLFTNVSLTTLIFFFLLSFLPLISS